MSNQKSKYAKVLDIRTVEITDKESGKKRKAAKVVFGKGVTIQLNGEDVDLGEYNSAFLQKVDEQLSRLQKLADDNKVSQEFVDKQSEYYAEKNISSVLEVKLK